ncbi:hypothetical protein BN135_754 [Cronobacter muytjensii 530]
MNTSSNRAVNSTKACPRARFFYTRKRQAKRGFKVVDAF